ncbi:MAG: anti-sigma factor antagonist [Acidimicrobiales bacterium]|jgi:anti-anti-sigma factor|nr:anti-sigma factor antagonist [Acidimicrobiales bacterium]
MDTSDRLTLEVRSAPEPQVTASGEVDAYTADALEQALTEARSGEGSPVLRLDLHDISFMDSTGLRVLVATNNELERTGGRLVLVNPSRGVLRLLDLTGLDGSLAVEHPPTGA